MLSLSWLVTLLTFFWVKLYELHFIWYIVGVIFVQSMSFVCQNITLDKYAIFSRVQDGKTVTITIWFMAVPLVRNGRILKYWCFVDRLFEMAPRLSYFNTGETEGREGTATGKVLSIWPHFSRKVLSCSARSFFFKCLQLRKKLSLISRDAIFPVRKGVALKKCDTPWAQKYIASMLSFALVAKKCQAKKNMPSNESYFNTPGTIGFEIFTVANIKNIPWKMTNSHCLFLPILVSNSVLSGWFPFMIRTS